MNENLKQLEIYTTFELLIKDIKDKYLVKYSKSVKIIYRTWYILQIITSVTGFLFAIVGSIAVLNQDLKIWGIELTIPMILLPALSSAISSLIIKFRIYDLWMIREYARIEYQKLSQQSQYFISIAETKEEIIRYYEIILYRLNQIEEEQQARFFAITTGDFKKPISATNSNEQTFNATMMKN